MRLRLRVACLHRLPLHVVMKLLMVILCMHVLKVWRSLLHVRIRRKLHWLLVHAGLWHLHLTHLLLMSRIHHGHEMSRPIVLVLHLHRVAELLVGWLHFLLLTTHHWRHELPWHVVVGRIRCLHLRRTLTHLLDHCLHVRAHHYYIPLQRS